MLENYDANIRWCCDSVMNMMNDKNKEIAKYEIKEWNKVTENWNRVKMLENYDANMCWSCDSVMNMMIDITPK